MKARWFAELSIRVGCVIISRVWAEFLDAGKDGLKVLEDWRALQLNEALAGGEAVITAGTVIVPVLVKVQHDGCDVVECKSYSHMFCDRSVVCQEMIDPAGQ